MASTTVFPARLRSVATTASLPILAAALALTGLTATSATAVAGGTAVTTFADLQAASSTCAGTSGDPTTIILADDVTGSGQVDVGCHLILDLAGYDLSVTNMAINWGQALTITDTGAGGTLTADASVGALERAGIDNAGGPLTIDGGTITATGGPYGPGIGGGPSSHPGATIILSGTVTAIGGQYAAGIGSSYARSGGETTVHGGTVTATGGQGGAGIGGGYGGSSGGVPSGEGGTTTVTGGTVVATGGQYAAGIGGGDVGAGGATTVEGGVVTAIGGSGGSAVGSGDAGTGFGSLVVDGGVLRLPAGVLRVPDSSVGVEVEIGPGGVVDGSAGPGATYADIVGNGQIDNGGRILLPTPSVTGGGVTVSDRQFVVGFDTQGGSSAPDPVTVFADTFEHGNRDFPPAPTRNGFVFDGWNTAADGSGDPVTASGVLPGSAVGGVPVGITAHAQWLQLHPAQVSGISPDSGPVAGGNDVVITGSGFIGTTQVFFGSGRPATSFVVDSDTQITAVAPASATKATRNVLVRNPLGTSPTTTDGRYTWTAPQPQVASISPETGPLAGGNEVVITGSGFTGATEVFFGGGNPATGFTVDSDIQITAVAPASATRAIRHVLVRTPHGTSAATPGDRYTWTAPRPQVISLSPDTGPVAGDNDVVITGTGFTGATQVFFGKDNPATSFEVDSDTQITAVAPASAGRATRHVLVRTPGGTTRATPGDRYNWR